MPTQKNVWVTNGGREFPSEGEAKAYEKVEELARWLHNQAIASGHLIAETYAKKVLDTWVLLPRTDPKNIWQQFDAAISALQGADLLVKPELTTHVRPIVNELERLLTSISHKLLVEDE